ncbi:PREDICTED: post-GPI attachment to proteins factor 3 [Polistes dominula]|uniref:Post-GPI attachment to proteins factor 3 n=1 Tax=Polistes dominula TaxID=743375 RepID=A0ABM1IPR7_POLDO|nr:PREDICTED: post-GPI attachment to proteins factor 3 [Polistes dominula]
MLKPAWVICLFLQICCFTNVIASIGDEAPFYNQCLIKYLKNHCQNNVTFNNPPPLSLSLLSWSCIEDCKYMCMWRTVDYFVSHGLRVPQFNGKWPFIRIFGFQEPASVLFSILNFYAHWVSYWKFKKKVNSKYPMFYVWTYFSLICLNGWFWSTIFHARDTDFTEVMDYSSAFAIVLTLLYCMLLRITYKHTKTFIILTCCYMSILYTHLTHLWSGAINYGYNMKFNVAIGFVTFVITMSWWYNVRRELSHAYLIGWFNILAVLSTLLEVLDFSPIFWIFDAHSLWHASTAPLTILIYRFITLDCLYLQTFYNKTILNMHHIN